MAPSPFGQHLPAADDVQEGLFAADAANRAAVVVVEISVDGDATRFRKRDRRLDLPALEITLFELERWLDVQAG